MNVGNQTQIEARFDCLDPVVLKLLAECRGFGVNKYGETSHQQIPVSDHLNHAINHINEHRRGDQSELHLVNAMCRLMFAIHGLHSQGKYVDEYWHPDTQKQLRETVAANVSSEAFQYVRNADPTPVVEYRDVVESDMGNWIHVRNGSKDGWSNVVFVGFDKKAEYHYVCKDHTGSDILRNWKYAKTVFDSSMTRDPVDSDIGEQVFVRDEETGHWYAVKLTHIRSSTSVFVYSTVDWAGEPYDFKYGEVKVLY